MHLRVGEHDENWFHWPNSNNILCMHIWTVMISVYGSCWIYFFLFSHHLDLKFAYFPFIPLSSSQPMLCNSPNVNCKSWDRRSRKIHVSLSVRLRSRTHRFPMQKEMGKCCTIDPHLMYSYVCEIFIWSTPVHWYDYDSS